VRLAAARTRPLTLHFAQPLLTATGEFRERSSIILELIDTEGLAGYGEAAPWPGFGSETVAEALGRLNDAAPLLQGAALQPGEWPDAIAAHFHRAPAARAALEGALWDLAARRAGIPLAHQFAAVLGGLAGTALERVQVSALLMAGAPEALRDEARRVSAAGYRAAKLKLGTGSLAEDLARVRAAREGLGPDVALRGDANGAWSERTAREAFDALAQFGLAYIEQPLPAGEIDGMARLRRDAPVRIAADESVATAAGAMRLLEAGAADVLVLKPATLGGPAQALGIAASARRTGCEVVFSHTFESAVGARHVLHCAAAWGDPDAIHGLDTHDLFVDDVGDAPAWHQAAVILGDAAGIGLTP
jgi:o-succinylbenzoate synthase